MTTFTSTDPTVEFTDTDGAVSFTATAPAVSFTAGYQSVTAGGVDAEEVRDLVATFLTADIGIDITHDDAGDTLSIGAEVQTFTPFLVLPLSVALVGGSITGDELTVAALAGGGPFPVPVGRSVLVAGDGADNGSYRALSEGGVPGYSDGVLTFDPVAQQPFTEAHVNKDVFSFNPFASLPYGGQVVSDGAGGYTLAQIAVPPVNTEAEGDLLTIVDAGGGNLFYEWAPPDFSSIVANDITATGTGLNAGLSTVQQLTNNMEGILDRWLFVAAFSLTNVDLSLYMAPVTSVATQPTLSEGSVPLQNADLWLFNQTDPAENGPYHCVGGSGVWTKYPNPDIFDPPGNGFRVTVNAPGETCDGATFLWVDNDATVQRRASFGFTPSTTGGRWMRQPAPTAVIDAPYTAP